MNSPSVSRAPVLIEFGEFSVVVLNIGRESATSTVENYIDDLADADQVRLQRVPTVGSN